MSEPLRYTSSVTAAVVYGEPNAKLSEEPYLKLHLEPDRAIEVATLTRSLGSLSRQYQDFISSQGLFDKAGEARLLVSSVSRGSIDIRFLIELAGAAQLPALIPGMIDKADLLLKFAEKIKHLLEPIRKELNQVEGFAASRLSMMRIIARRMKAVTVVA